MPARGSSGASGGLPAFDPRWLLFLGIFGGSVILVNVALPKAGTAIAAGIAGWWLIDSGSLAYITSKTQMLVKEYTGK